MYLCIMQKWERIFFTNIKGNNCSLTNEVLSYLSSFIFLNYIHFPNWFPILSFLMVIECRFFLLMGFISPSPFPALEITTALFQEV